MDPRITEINKTDHTLMENDSHLDVTPLYVLAVRHYLIKPFSEHSISRRGTIQRPSMSPDLIPLQFFFLVYLKTRVYASPQENLKELRQQIFQECRLLTLEVFTNVSSVSQGKIHYTRTF